MKIKSIELTNSGREKPIKIVVSAESKEINANVLHVFFNNTDWYFKVTKAICTSVTETVTASEIIAESYGYYQHIRRNIDSVEDFGQMIGLEPDIVTDREKLKELSDQSCWC